jgi:3alpha(or 20beta)-hydroxysteroid dehydrogenase
VKRLEGKVALITGGARGQGEAEARLFAAEGAKVVVTDVLDEAGEKVAAEIGPAAIYRHLDVRSEEGWANVVDEATSAFGKLDVLVNNAGIVRAGALEATTLSDYMEVIEINQVGVFLGRAVRGMTKTAALEFGQYGIRVNSVHPGGVDTPMLQSDELGSVDQSVSFASQPIPRISQPIEIARVVLFLASDEASFCTGAEFAADGGRMAGHRDPGLGD